MVPCAAVYEVLCTSAHPALVTLEMKAGSTVTAELVAVDVEQGIILVKSLETPMGCFPAARIKTEEVASLRMDISEEDVLRLLDPSTTCASSASAE